jgi:hypothetical protein
VLGFGPRDGTPLLGLCGCLVKDPGPLFTILRAHGKGSLSLLYGPDSCGVRQRTPGIMSRAGAPGQQPVSSAHPKPHLKILRNSPAFQQSAIILRSPRCIRRTFLPCPWAAAPPFCRPAGPAYFGRNTSTPGKTTYFAPGDPCSVFAGSRRGAWASPAPVRRARSVLPACCWDATRPVWRASGRKKRSNWAGNTAAKPPPRRRARRKWCFPAATGRRGCIRPTCKTGQPPCAPAAMPRARRRPCWPGAWANAR